jgi:hypothetical protein
MIDKPSILRQKVQYSAGLAQFKLSEIRPAILRIKTTVSDYKVRPNLHKVTAP